MSTVMDPDLYAKLDVPLSKEAAEEAVSAFVAEVERLRVEHKIPDLVYAVRMNVDGKDALASGWRGSEVVSRLLAASMYRDARRGVVEALDRVAGIGVDVEAER